MYSFCNFIISGNILGTFGDGSEVLELELGNFQIFRFKLLPAFWILGWPHMSLAFVSSTSTEVSTHCMPGG